MADDVLDRARGTCTSDIRRGSDGKAKGVRLGCCDGEIWRREVVLGAPSGRTCELYLWIVQQMMRQQTRRSRSFGAPNKSSRLSQRKGATTHGMK